jgi:uncharacterized protein (DUF58 family)
MLRRLHHMSICREGFLYLAVMGIMLSAAVIRQINLLMVLYGVLAGPLLLSWRLVRWTLKKVDVTRQAPKTVFAGEPFRVQVSLKNGRKRGGSFAIHVRDELRRRNSNEPSIGAETYFSFVPAGETRTASYRGSIGRRGIYDFQPLKVSSRFPLGLLKTMLRFDRPARLIVFPAMGKMSGSWRRLLSADDELAPVQRQARSALDGEFYGLRDWRQGDGRNRVHWRTSARRQTLTVRQYERRRHVSFALVVDLWRPEKPSPDDLGRVEQVVSFAATLLGEACRGGDQPLTAEVIGQTHRKLRAAASAGAVHEALRVLAGVEATAEDRLAATLAELYGELRPATGVIVVSTRAVDLLDREKFPQLHARSDLYHRIARTPCLSPDDGLWRETFAGAPR